MGGKTKTASSIFVVKVFFLTILVLTILAIVVDPILNGGYKWPYVVYSTVLFFLISPGVNVFLHRHLAHLAFKMNPRLKFQMGIQAGMNGQDIGSWAGRHRQHHARSDQAGDPHSPIVDWYGNPHKSRWRGFGWSHFNWMFDPNITPNLKRWGKDILRDPIIRLLDKFSLLWLLSGLALPIVVAVDGALILEVLKVLIYQVEFVSPDFELIAWYALVWGGFVRLFFTYNITWSINSVCHLFGMKDYNTGDQSRNVIVLQVPTLGESLHNWHHQFSHWAWVYLGKIETVSLKLVLLNRLHFQAYIPVPIVDLSGLQIWAMEKLGLVYDVKHPDPMKRREKGVNFVEPILVPNLKLAWVA